MFNGFMETKMKLNNKGFLKSFSMVEILMGIGVLAGGAYVALDEGMRNAIFTSGAGIIIGLLSLLNPLLELFDFIISPLTYLLASILGILSFSVTLLGSGFILLFSIIFLMIQIIIFLLTHFYTIFMLFEFFVLASCIHREGKPHEKIGYLVSYHLMFFTFGIMLITFIIKLPEFAMKIYDLTRKILMDIWKILSDFAKVIAELIPG